MGNVIDLNLLAAYIEDNRPPGDYRYVDRYLQEHPDFLRLSKDILKCYKDFKTEIPAYVQEKVLQRFCR